jgi:pre-mRNA-processing factor 6
VLRSEAQARRGEEPEVDPDQFQDPDNEYGLFAGTAYEQDDEEADKIYEAVDQAMDSRRKVRRCVQWSVYIFVFRHDFYPFLFYREAREEEELKKHRAERPKIQQQFADLKRGLSAVTDSEWESIPEVSNLTRKKRRKEERTYALPDSIIVGDRAKGEYENSLDVRQQEVRSITLDNVFSFLCLIPEWWLRNPSTWNDDKLCGNWRSIHQDSIA